MTVSWHESPTGKISQVTLEVPSAFDVVAPEGLEALHEPARRVDLEVLSGRDVDDTRVPMPA